MVRSFSCYFGLRVGPVFDVSRLFFWPIRTRRKSPLNGLLVAIVRVQFRAPLVASPNSSINILCPFSSSRLWPDSPKLL